VTGRRKSFAVDLKGSRRVQLASWRNLILTFRTFDLIRQFVGRSVVRSSTRVDRPFGVVLVPS
jgi:hypothetical protein